MTRRWHTRQWLWLAAGVWAAGLLAWQWGAGAPHGPLVLSPHQAAEGFNVSVSPLGLANLPGTPLSGRPAPPFALRNTEGRVVTLTSLAGRVVVLTFVNLDAHNGQGQGVGRLLAAARRRLGGRAGRVAFLAVAVNRRAGPAAMQRWAAAHAGIIVLSGSAKALGRVWRAYGVGVAGQGPTLRYTPAVYVLSPQGHEEILTVAAPAGVSRQAADLVRDVEAWLG